MSKNVASALWCFVMTAQSINALVLVNELQRLLFQWNCQLLSILTSICLIFAKTTNLDAKKYLLTKKSYSNMKSMAIFRLVEFLPNWYIDK